MKPLHKLKGKIQTTVNRHWQPKRPSAPGNASAPGAPPESRPSGNELPVNVAKPSGTGSDPPVPVVRAKAYIAKEVTFSDPVLAPSARDLPIKATKPSVISPPVVKESVTVSLTLALGLVEKGANIATHVPWMAPVFSLLSEIVKIYKDMKATDEKRDQLLCRVTGITNDLCGTILRMEETNHDNLIGRLKPDVEKYTVLIQKVKDAIRVYDSQKRAVRIWAHNELGSELDALNHELDWTAARFTNNRLVDLVFKQDKNTETLKLIDERGLKGKLEEWLQFPPQMMEKQNDMENLHQKGTGSWLFEDKRFMAWQDHAGFLWIQAGAGKSVLCSTVIRKLLEDQQLFKTASPTIAHFYFDFRDEKKQSVEIALRRILLQLSARSSHPYQILNEEYNKSSGQNLPNYEQLLHILKELLGKLGRTYSVLDALDECKEADYQRLVELLSTLQSWSGISLHLLVTSQPRGIFTETFGDVACITLEPQVTETDIRFYVTTQLQNSYKLKKLAKYKEDITNAIVDKSKGMFRLAACLLMELSQYPLPGRLKETLSELPDDLHEVYDRFLMTICKKHPVYVERLLCFLLFSARAVTLDELDDALAVDISSVNEDSFHPEQRGLASIICQGLEGLVNTVKSDYSYNHHTTVHLAHASVQEYFLSTKFRERFKCDVRENISHHLMAQTCIGYLLYFSNHPLNAENIRDYPLSLYASNNWYRHLLRCSGSSRKGLLGPAMKLLENGTHLWYHLQDAENAYLKRNWIIWWDRGYTDGVWGNALQAAAFMGKTEIVHVLLKKGANVNTQGGQYGNALEAAAYEGNTEIVHLLLEKGANINAQGGPYSNALQAAAHKGNTEIVHLLLEKGANINAQGGQYGNALQAAGSGGNTEILHLLLEKGANINAWGGKYDNALQAAACGGNIEIVHLLLEKDANINAQGGRYGNALQAAACEGKPEIVHLLIEKGADINAQGGQYGNALQAAAFMGKTGIVNLLLENGADINAQGGEYFNALQAAALKGKTEIVHLLLEKGADINAQGGYYGNASQAAAFGGQTELVYFLLEKGGHINAQGTYFGNALQAAASGGKIEIVHLLLEKGANINAQGGVWGNALQAAASGGKTRVVHLLLEKGADINAQGGVWGNALQAAAREGQLEIVHHLIAKGAHINAQGGQYGNALQAAACEGKLEIVRLLIQKGADINAQGGQFGNALQAAASEGNTGIIHLLLEKGADINAQGGEYAEYVIVLS